MDLFQVEDCDSWVICYLHPQLGGGGFKYFVYFHPNLGKISNLTNTWIFQVCKTCAFSPKKPTKRQKIYISRRSRYFSDGLVQPPSSQSLRAFRPGTCKVAKGPRRKLLILIGFQSHDFFVRKCWCQTSPSFFSENFGVKCFSRELSPFRVLLDG